MYHTVIMIVYSMAGFDALMEAERGEIITPPINKSVKSPATYRILFLHLFFSLYSQ